MELTTYIPKEKLSAYAEFIWYSNEESPSAAKERVLPNGASQLIINLGNDSFRHFSDSHLQQNQEYDHTVLTGIHTRHIFMDPSTRLSTLGVVLRPGAVSSLFGIPASEFKNQVVGLEAVMKTDISALRQQLIDAPATEEKFKLLETFLCRELNVDFRLNPAIVFGIQQIDQQHGAKPISDIRAKTGYSRRWFSKNFKEMAGVTPKQYARICRFQHALNMIRASDNPNWASLALSCGYFDQAHFIHDFRKLAGTSPTVYHRNQTDQKNHLPA